MSSFLRKLTLTCSLLLFSSLAICAPSARIAEENEIKAAFIYNFLKFVEWPNESFSENDSKLKICVIEECDLGEKVTLINGRMAAQRLIVVQQIQNKSSINECNVLVICSEDEEVVKTHLQRVINRPILTIGVCKNFARLGGMIGLFTISGKVRFSINLKEADASGLKISSQLLKLAVEVIR
jgi:hypothetical protein